jgi:predicted secreted acid phosphatase
MFNRAYCAAAVVVALAAMLTPVPAVAAEPTNLSLGKHAVAAYVSSGEYAREIANVSLATNEYLLKRIPRGAEPGKKLAIVFDINETMITSTAEIVANDYGYVPKVWDNWVAKGEAPAILPVQSVYETALQGKIDILIITGRTEKDRVATEKNLHRVGYKNWTRIVYRSATDLPGNADFKTEVRRKLTEEGYQIIANIGDQASDLSNGYAEQTFKLPNPFYLVK